MRICGLCAGRVGTCRVSLGLQRKKLCYASSGLVVINKCDRKVSNGLKSTKICRIQLSSFDHARLRLVGQR